MSGVLFCDAAKQVRKTALRASIIYTVKTVSRDMACGARVTSSYVISQAPRHTGDKINLTPKYKQFF